MIIKKLMYTVHKKSVKDRFNKKFVATYFLENCKYCMNVEVRKDKTTNTSYCSNIKKKKIPLFIQTADYFLSNALDKNILLNGASLKINGRKHSQI